MRYTLGLATMDNSAAALFCDGDLIAAIEEERLSRIKNDGSFPHLAIAEVLQIAGITLADLDRIAVYWQPWRVKTRALGSLRKITASPAARAAVTSRIRDMFAPSGQEEKPDGSWGDLFRLRRILTSEHGPTKAKLHFVDHHRSHQLYAETMRDWSDCVSLSYDGGGEAHSTVLTVLKGNNRDVLTRHRWPNSLGHFYSTFTGFLGFRMLEGEYKMMGLAPYGEPVWRETILKEILHLDDDGRYRLDTVLCDYHAALKGVFHPRLSELFSPPRAPDETPTKAHVDLAASVQAAHEAALKHVLQPAQDAYPELKRLALSGGCALNVTANGRLLEDGIFDEIIIPPAPHDAGCAIGAALSVLPAAVNREAVRSPYLGRDFSQDEISAALSTHCHRIPDAMDEAKLIDRTATMLSEGRLVAWFQGRAEFGPRALGARSFLADPRRDEIRDALNDKIKKRELFRPFAPSTTEEAAADFFAIAQTSPYMNIVAKVRDDRVPAITHVDGTARVHTVSATAHRRYHALITRFGEITGVPVLLNTSFNIQEPIVYSPEQALATFAASGVDALVMGDHIVMRDDLK
ncbi:carbamoyltransferase family protein [Paracoccus aerodenitrificans]|uniref:carbamoyltransferase family protein n=1 Tax=Paracoccus aerodenitrificans TaxID=3017781 RepID=UPI0022F12530|nr:carbamoyltransferase C-terminal domain-containing protein [Paracoccus aerodenitrificans]WBU63656.1 hypothetical protein PAE61_15145 [Paracoccus aerodenitrificans]